MPTITTSSPIVGKADGSPAIVAEWLATQPTTVRRRPDLWLYLDEVYRLCGLVGINADLLVAQSAHETANWSDASPWWPKRLNPAGIGITGDPAQDAASHTWANGTEAARAHVVHMSTYVWRTQDAPQASINVLDPYLDLDPRYLAVADAGFGGTVRVLGDLGNGKWAADPDYAPQIAAKAQAIFKEVQPVPSLNMTKGLIPLPAILNRLIPDANTTAWDDLGQRTVKGFVLHRMLGSLGGTDAYFRNDGGDKGLTDFGQDANSGKVYQWNDPLGLAHPGVSANRAGWASGVFNVHGDAYGDGLAFEQKYGLDGINRDEVSWEISGQYGDPWSEAAMDVAAQACAHYAHDYGIPYDRFPIAPQDGFSFVRWHQEITGPAEKICPGPVVMQQTPQFIQKVQAIMQKAQTGTATPQPSEKPPAVPTIPWKRGAVGVVEINGAKALAMVGEVTARRNVPLREGASSKSKVVKTLNAHHTAVIVGTIRQPAGRWAFIQVDDSGATYRAPLSAFSPQFPVL